MLRVLQRGFIAVLLILALPITLWILIAKGGATPDASLTALVGAVVGAIGKSLSDLVSSLASNPSDRGDDEPEA